MENSKQMPIGDIVTVEAVAATTNEPELTQTVAPHAAAIIINIPNEIVANESEATTTPTPPATPTPLPSPSPSPLPSPLSSPITTPAKTNHLYAAASTTSLAYDTDCSVASSTCCTRYGEHIYMQRCAIDMLEQEQQQQRKTHASAKDDVVYAKPEQYKNKWPVFIVLISLVEIAIFVYDYLSIQMTTTNTANGNAALSAEQSQSQASLLLPVPIPTDSVFIYRPDRRLEVWRFVSYMFLHANSFHLGFNVVVQLFYGIPLEVMHGSARIAIIYFAGVFAGSLGTSVVDSEVYLVGASGGVYALLAAHLANITLNFGQMRYAVAQLFSVVIFVTCDLAYAVYTQYLAVDVPSKTPPVSYIAHLTGALAGLTIGLLVLKNFEQRAYENVIWWLALGIYSAFTIFAVVFNLINTVTAQLMEEQGEEITQHLLHDLGVS